MERGGEPGCQGISKPGVQLGSTAPQNTEHQTWKSHSLDPPPQVRGRRGKGDLGHQVAGGCRRAKALGAGWPLRPRTTVQTTHLPSSVWPGDPALEQLRHTD